MSKAATKALIDEKITGNGVQAITGPILNNVLNTMVDDYGTQEEVSQLAQKVNGAIYHSKNLADYATVWEGYYPDASGYITTNAATKSIKFPCAPSTTYTITKVVTNHFRVAYYSTNPVAGTLGGGVITNNSASSITITTAADSQYIVFYVADGNTTSTMTQILASLQIEISAEPTEYEAPGWIARDTEARERLTVVEAVVPQVEENTKALEGEDVALSSDDVTTGKYWGTTGELVTLSGWFYSDPILVHKGDKVVTSESFTPPAGVSVITRVSSENAFLEVLKEGTGQTETINYTILEDCYISISAPNARRSLFTIKQNGVSQRIDILAQDVLGFGPDRLPVINDNPLYEIKREPGYGAVIRKWGIIGDSLSSGEMQCYNDESASASDYKFLDMYQYSSGQVFARLVGATAYNYSNGGQTAWGWLKSQGTVHDETYIGGVGGGDWRLAKQAGQEKDGYIIALGVNDLTKINNNDYELGSTSQITEYDGTDSDIDDTTTYPKSFVRYYAGIIQRVLSIQPKAKIFCVTPLGDNYASIAQAIRDIVTYFGGNVYLLDMRTYIPAGYNVQGFKLQGHLSPMGYAYIGYLFNTYIDWIIRKNGDAFRDTALIGTDYRPNYS